MAATQLGLVASFAYLDNLLEAIETLHRSGYKDIQALSPVPHHAIDDALEKPKSPVRFFTLAGCLLGCATGLALTIGSSLHYPLITGGKPIVSLPPFFIISFELTILFGGLFTLAGMLLNGRLPLLRAVPAYNPRFAEDRFGLWVRCSTEESEVVTRLMTDAGAEEVNRAGTQDSGLGTRGSEESES